MQRLVNVVIPPLKQAFTYSIEPSLEKHALIGSQVTVPFGNRRARGFIVSEITGKEADEIKNKMQLKSISKENETQHCFHADELSFFSWVAEYYGDSLANVIDVAIPNPAPQKIQRYISLKKEVALEELRGTSQRNIYRYLQGQTGPVAFDQLSKIHKGASTVIRRLEELEIVSIASQEIYDKHISKEAIPDWTKANVDLNKKQEYAVDLICKNAKEKVATPILLHGITGSGKTEVYIEAIKKVLEQGQGALILVPEIALTPQLIDRFRARLGQNIAILHSALSRRVRWDAWRALLEGRNHVAIGARSGVFAPVPNLGVIFVDEEHDTSYKQSEGLRYNARDLAIMRAKFLNCPVVLGSATPSLETFHHALAKKYVYIDLPERHAVENSINASSLGATRLNVEMVDLNKIKPWEMPAKNVSPQLLSALKQTIASNGQAFILYNRRGFASYLQCETCEAVIQCPNCCVTMTYHQFTNNLLCHYCNLSQVPPQFCSHCAPQGQVTFENAISNNNLKGDSKENKVAGTLSHRGAGTEKVFDELKELLPEARIDRLDRDAVSDLDSYRLILQNVRDGKTQILVGTQMIAKGHDLPGVTLVGVVDCDVGLHMPDFRAAERIYQLLTQASGRAGRGIHPGSVILQTRVPKHHSLTTTVQQNYFEFAKQELEVRKQTQYPPYSRLVRIVASSSDKEQAGAYLAGLKVRIIEILGKSTTGIVVLGPALAPLEKLKNQWRWHMMIKGQSASALNKLVRIIALAKPKTKTIKVIIDVDPQEML